MRIALDYTAAASHWPGVGRYGRELVRALVRRADCPELVLFEHGSGAALPAAALGLDVAPAGRVRRVRIPGRRRTLAWRSRLGLGGIARRLGRVDLVHRAFPLEQLGAVRGCPEVMPLFELPAPDAGRDAALARSLAPHARVVVGSAAGRLEVADRLGAHGLDTTRLCDFITGADHWLRDADLLDTAELAAAGPPRFLVLGAIAHARRPLAILAAFEALAAPKPAAERPLLVFDGRPGDAAGEFAAALAASPVAEHVTWNPEPREAALPQLVASSAVLVHLSRGELSPITPLEALHFGGAAVLSALPSFTEALGSAAELVEPEVEADPGALAAVMAAAMDSAFDPAARESRRALVARFTWDASAADHLALWAELAQSPV
jgi:glycosyltransferase involved in cell wall biosynthesis